MMTPQSLPWADPLALAAAINDPVMVLLHSGVVSEDSGRFSYLAHDLAERIEGDDIGALEKKLSANRAPFDNCWFGYLSYGLKNQLETLPEDQPNWLSVPNFCMLRFRSVYQFDHIAKSLLLWSENHPNALALHERKSYIPPKVSKFTSGMTDNEYLEKVAAIIADIHNGKLYQANLTRKYIGEWVEIPDDIALFGRLNDCSPAAYSAFLRIDGISILSSSPELFLRVTPEGEVTTRPIKGTAPRFPEAKDDTASAQRLAASEKDCAENLMIVDLMRNDLAKHCILGSINVPQLFEVTTHATIHHMSSCITGKKRLDVSALALALGCFPPGSMTGAPKIAAMQLCSKHESLSRGIYSGSIGAFFGDGSAVLSVVIRTLILRRKRFEFQVGGGVVADSKPIDELKEHIEKAKGICNALQISLDWLNI